MPKKVFTPAQIVGNVRQIERQLASGKAASVVYKRAGVTEQVYRRWRKQYGGLAKRLKELEQALKARDRDLTESLEQQTATAEILRIISDSLIDTQPVFDAIVKNCGSLFEDSRVVLWLISDNRLYARAINSGESPPEVSIDRGSAIGVCVLDGHMVHLPDLEKATEQYPRVRELGLKFGYRSGIYAPLLREGRAIGSISVVRREAGAFDAKEVALLKTFADQAVIAIENVRLFKELQARNRELTESLEQQTATSEILRVISSSPTDIQPVLDAVAESAARLCGAHDVVIRLVDGDMHRAVAHHGPIPPLGPLPVRGSIAGRAIVERRTLHIQDIRAPNVRTEFREADATARGYRTFLAAPLVREDTAVGAIVIRRGEVSPFTDKQIKLLETFASQAVIAIENVRLFKEL